MSGPAMNQPAQAGGYRQMGGGYEDAIAQAQNRGPVQQQPRMQQQPGQQFVPQQQQPQQQAFTQQPVQPQWSPSQGMMQLPQEGYPVNQIPPQQQPQPQIQPQVQQQPGWPGVQQGMPQQGQPGVDLNARLTGQGVPPELQGRTVQELVAIHNGLRQVHLQSLAGNGVTQQPVPQQQPTQQQAPAGGQQQAQGWDWRNPDQSTERVVERVLDRAITERLAPMLAPMQQQSAISTIHTARSQAVAQIGPQRYAQLEPLINQSLQGIDPRALMNPATWVVAAERAAGQLVLQGQQVGGQVQQQPQQGGPGIYPVQQVGPGQNPMPNLNTFFSETPAQGGSGPQQTAQLTPAQAAAADAMQMSHATYAAWLGGVR